MKVLAFALVLALAGCATRSPAQRQMNQLAEVREAITAQLMDCWPSRIGLAARPREKLDATVRVQFGPDGRFVRAPEILAPKSWPSDPAGQTYLGSVLIALRLCSEKGFQLPRSYFDMGAPPIELRIHPTWSRPLPRSVET